MTFANRLEVLVKSGTPLISVSTEEVLACIQVINTIPDTLVFQWDLIRGLAPSNEVAAQWALDESGPMGVTDEAEVVEWAARTMNDDRAIVVCFQQAQTLLDGNMADEFCQHLLNNIEALGAIGNSLVFLCTDHKHPPTMERYIQCLSDSLPDTGGYKKIIDDAVKAATESGMSVELNDNQKHTLAENCAGLSEFQATQLLSQSLAEHEDLRPSTIFAAKAEIVKRHPALTLFNDPEATFDNLGGLDAIRQRSLRIINSTSDLPWHGFLLLGVPGAGKSQFAKALGNEINYPVLMLDAGALYGSLVGESERNARSALQIIDAMSPCVLIMDEIEKGLSGSQSSGQTDSGTSARVFGSMLTWLNDHKSKVFVIATSNDINKLPPEFSRAERWDGLYFVDLPDQETRAIIWSIYLEMFGVSDEQATDYDEIDDEGWTGAEIKSACRIAAIENITLVEAAKSVVPVSVTAAEKMTGLRQWATNRCLDANTGDVFGVQASRTNSDKSTSKAKKAGRRIRR
jgi:SpoVK/Ycf46/Vps4 family AAA+-type ATPase